MPPVPGAGGLGRDNAENILRYSYPERRVWNLINRDKPVIARLRRRGWPVREGRMFAVNLLTAYSDGGGERLERDRTPEPDLNEHQWAYFNYVRYDRTAQWTGEVIETQEAQVDPIADEMDGALAAAGLQKELMIWVPASGLLASIVSVTDATHVKVDNYQWLTRRKRVDILVRSTGASTNAIVNSRILKITPDSDDSSVATVQIESPLSDYAQVDTTYGIYGTNARNKNFFSLPDIVSSSNPSIANYGMIDRAAVEEWQALEDSANGTAVTARLLASMRTQIGLRSGEGLLPNVCWVHPFVLDDLIHRAENKREYGATVKEFQVWGKGVMIDDMVVLKARFCPFDKAFFLYEPAFRMAHPPKMPNGRWVREGKRGTEGPILRLVPGYWMYEALWVELRQIVCTRPNACGVLHDIAWAPRGMV